jgi:holo-[acyl-carrier protein] synthase
MIGMGVDMVQISEFEKQINDHASVFVENTFTMKERLYAQKHPSNHPSRHLAARFAAKEALIKAWASLRIGQPLKQKNPNFQEIEVCNDPYGRPFLSLHGSFKEELKQYIHKISLSHDGDYAIATVVLQEI